MKLRPSASRPVRADRRVGQLRRDRREVLLLLYLLAQRPVVGLEDLLSELLEQQVAHGGE